MTFFFILFHSNFFWVKILSIEFHSIQFHNSKKWLFQYEFNDNTILMRMYVCKCTIRIWYRYCLPHTIVVKPLVIRSLLQDNYTSIRKWIVCQQFSGLWNWDRRESHSLNMHSFIHSFSRCKLLCVCVHIMNSNIYVEHIWIWCEITTGV